MKECSFEPGLAVKISGVGPGNNYKQLIAHARFLDLCPSWAIIRGGYGVIAFETLNDSNNAALLLNGSLFLGATLQAKPCTHYSYAQFKMHNQCNFGFACKGRFSYCIFAHSHDLSDSSVVSRRRSPRIRGAVEDIVDDHVVRVVFDTLDNTVIANHLLVFCPWTHNALCVVMFRDR